jgi:ABC-type multidrug transport system fused ATPase/permease subunit
VKLVTELRYILSRRERIDGSILLCGMVLGAMFEAVSIGLVVPFVAVLREPELLGVSAARAVFVFLDIHEPQRMLIAVGIGLISLFIIKSGYLLLLSRWQYQYIFETHTRLGSRLLRGYLNAPYVFHLQRNSAELIKATTESVQRFTSGFLLGLLTVLGELLVVLAVTALLMIIDPVATLGAILVLGFPTALMYIAMQRRLAVAGRTAEQSAASTIQWIEQAISGIKETLVTGRASFFIDWYGRHVSRLAQSTSTFSFLSGIPRLLIDTLAVSAMVAVALIALARGQDLQAILPILTMFAVAAIRLMPSTHRIANGLAQARYHYAATEVIYRDLTETQGYGLELVKSRSDVVRSVPVTFQRVLTLENLSYQYPSMPLPAIHDVSFEIPRGHWVAFIGPTGAGKTTLIDLILGLFLPTSGRILIDGIDLQENVRGWQRNIGYVPQDIYLLDDTVRRNVTFGLPDNEINDEQVWRALQAAHVDRLVRSLPGGLDAMIGERGDRLSGGERQRLGIARALYHDPQVLIVDEGTAHLDNETEAAIAGTLEALRGEKTIIMIAHRIALIRNCDTIFLLKQGKVQKSGVYSELVSTDPALRDLPGVAS